MLGRGTSPKGKSHIACFISSLQPSTFLRHHTEEILMTSSWFWEGNVVDAVCKFLEK